MLFRCIAVYCLTRAFADESCSSPEADIDTCIPEEETLLLQVGVKLNPAWNSSFDVAVNGNLTFSQLSLHRSVLTSGASFGPKTSAALFLLLSTTFGFLCLCGNAKPFITAPYSGFPDDEDESETVRQQSLVACYFVVFMDAFGFGVYAPFVPVLAKTFSLQAHDIATVLATFSLAQALNTPVLGYLSDRFGRRPVLLAALAAESLSYIILSVAESFTILLIGYIFAGAFCATIGVCNAYIASVSTEEDRPIRLAYSSGSIALGLMLGPVLGAALSHQGFAAAVRICAFLSMLNWTFVFSFMAESPHFLLRRQPKFDMGFRFDSLPRLAWPLFLGAFLGNAGIAAAESCGALYVMDSYFRGTRMTAVESTRFWAWNMFISGAVVIIITYWVFPSLMHRLKQQSTMLLGRACSGH
ncbi:unnamed protein product [Effrenium voratum]|uniref:Major facilitator superfamily (MFS) profile domain-containing protein n=1 Tax=Effrenium voratum TaxID=2562239 RepID=A0AA36MZ49_9DINO|nr:unnamed protein product [Effrenium voratum]